MVISSLVAVDDLVAIEDAPRIGGDCLSRRLRSETRQAHRDGEAAFDLERRLSDRCTYGSLLGELRSFFAVAEEIVASVSGWDRLTPKIDIASRRRTYLLDADLAQLGLDSHSGHHDPLPGFRANPSLARGLGLLYVLEGSALGGRIIAKQALIALGADLPVSFFDGAQRPLGTDWKALQRALDAFSQLEGAQGELDVIGAAAEAFTAFGSWLDHRTCLV